MQMKLISSLEKCFLDESLADKKEYKNASCFKNELYHFGICYSIEKEIESSKKYVYLSIESAIA